MIIVNDACERADPWDNGLVPWQLGVGGCGENVPTENINHDRRAGEQSPKGRERVLGRSARQWETLAPPPGVSCPGIAESPHRLRPAGTLDGPRPVPERLHGKAWRVTRRPATFHPVFEAPPRSSNLKSPVVVLKSRQWSGLPRSCTTSVVAERSRAECSRPLPRRELAPKRQELSPRAVRRPADRR